ncbi:MAG: epoxyqueuosine reductase QueH [Dehalococcoidales bacterium]|nr:epoxyqueuosine reductase QueH [Dehalococcoidales bacterium]
MQVVLHICCGVCAAGVVERLVSEGNQVSGFFYNPNIHPAEEYQRRLAAAQRVAQEFNFPMVEGAYMPEDWYQAADHLEAEPEGGKRCEVCYRIRLKRTFQYLTESGGDAFTTTLTVSPRKPADVVNRVGWEVGGDRFLIRDFKKKAGFQRATELAREWRLHRQDYCGCLYSLRSRNAPENQGQPLRW